MTALRMGVKVRLGVNSRRAAGLGAAVALAAAGCEAPDSSALFGPVEPGAIHTQAPRIEPSPASPQSDTTGDAESVAAPPAAMPRPSDAPGGAGSPTRLGSDAAPPRERPLPSPRSVLDAGLGPDPLFADAAEPAEPSQPAEPSCSGTVQDGVCWHLGELSQSCQEVCAARGGIDPAAVARIGAPAQGGSLDACAALLAALGEPLAAVLEGYRDDQLGFGCHLFLAADGTASAWWLTSPEFSPAASDPSARLVCGCAA